MNVLGESIQGAWGVRLVSPDAVEAAATQKILTGRESMGIGEAISLAQILTKTAQTTPPPTTGM